MVKISLEDWKKATSKYENALVAYVFGYNPPLGKIKGFVRSKWGGEDEVKVSLLNEGIYLLNFTNYRKKMDVLLGGPWTFDNRPFIVKHWKEDEEYKCGSISSLPVWIRLPNIKVHLTNLKLLSQLCSSIGKPLCTDGVTAEGTSFNYARVCVEVRAERELADSIFYSDPSGNTHRQKVLYEWKPPRCKNCINFGHNTESCPKDNFEMMRKAIVLQEEKEAWKQMKDIQMEVDDDESTAEEEEFPNKRETKGLNMVVDSDSSNSNNRSIARVPETPLSNNVSSEGSDKSNGSDEVTIAEQFKEVVSKSAAKRARKLERIAEKERIMAERERSEARDKFGKGQFYKKAAKEIREQEEREFNLRKKDKTSKKGGKFKKSY